MLWHFGLEDSLIHSNFADPDFTASLGRDRTYDAPNTFVGGSEFRRLNEAVEGQLTTPAPPETGVPYLNSYISLGELRNAGVRT